MVKGNTERNNFVEWRTLGYILMVEFVSSVLRKFATHVFWFCRFSEKSAIDGTVKSPPPLKHANLAKSNSKLGWPSLLIWTKPMIRGHASGWSPKAHYFGPWNRANYVLVQMVRAKSVHIINHSLSGAFSFQVDDFWRALASCCVCLLGLKAIKPDRLESNYSDSLVARWESIHLL